MTTAKLIRDDFINFLVDEYSKEKQKSNLYNDTNISETVTNETKNTNRTTYYYIMYVLCKIFYMTVYLTRKFSLFLYLYVKTFIYMSLNFSYFLFKNFLKIYKPTINFIDNYFTKFLKRTCELISIFTYNLSIKLYKYGKDRKYYKIKVGERKYSDMDLARMASGIGDYENLTLKDIQERFTIGYDTAIKVRDMRNDTLKMLHLLKEAYASHINTN